ncbi:methyltransferase [Lachnospiraceae bacterium NSJ-29]|uniref:Methyltransferase n=1 Tax=Wansuia hejianensis TaxID=2763667 RepID=A0A926F3S0_9FIRM|nr:methyltransferase [Wansuia hejianensis]
MKEILVDVGFKNIEINLKEVTDEYAKKWGYGLKIKEYIGSGDILAYK